MNLKNNLGAVLFWSVISAAFIGPGTVTTAAAAGAAYGIDLVWVLVISTLACAVLQVNVTRITIQSDKTLGELLLDNFRKYRFIPVALGFSIVFGCIAYQAGNLLGASLGISLLLDVSQKWVLVIIVLLSSAMLWFGSIQLIVRGLGGIVAIMGLAFVIITFSTGFSFIDIVAVSVTPSIPAGSEILIMGLIGTTIVPYNLFLGSGLSKGKELSASVVGLVLAISLGGIISIAILLSGTLISGTFDFQKLSHELTTQLGSWANVLLGIGLFSAGFTSSLTAPLAAVFTMRSIFPQHRTLQDRQSRSYRAIWGVIMGSGLVFGFFNIKPIPAIILAQAINGIILPFIAVFILILVGSANIGSKPGSINVTLLAIVVFLLIVIGSFSFLKILFDPSLSLIVSSVVFGVLVVGAVLVLMTRRKKANGQ